MMLMMTIHAIVVIRIIRVRTRWVNMKLVIQRFSYLVIGHGRELE